MPVAWMFVYLWYQVQVQELNVQLFNEKKQNEEKIFETEQLRKDIQHHKWVLLL